MFIFKSSKICHFDIAEDQVREAKKFKTPNPTSQQMPPVNQPYVVFYMH
jgi:hypothetical protein